MPLNLPNLLTWLRILLIPLFLGTFYLPEGWLSPFHKNVTATLIFALAAVTDWLDGYLARILNQTSSFGAFLDPVADKLMVAAALLLLVALARVDGVIAFIIIGREIAISALREWMAVIGERKSVAVSFLGKVKTTCQMTAILLLLFHEKLGGVIDSQLLGTWLIYIAAALTLWSMAYYLKLAMPRAIEEVPPGKAENAPE
ncbi:MAG TPA: CDP-diacylglycerol--glycerol-3-phosphate 3-phosphatidyltransferase [Burkholderiales bacterium]|nr:CDP-diacylglycerol--glycerol-3-phosphate 3-phosphatidyltransferase [Burkholderiales bacterium]